MQNMTNSSLIFIGGNAPDNSILMWKNQLIVAVDAGLRTCLDWKIIPDVILGDFDSISLEEAQNLVPEALFLEFDTDKDVTDLELALEYCYSHSKSIPDITVIGGFGGRIEHFIAILYLLKGNNPPHRVIGRQYQCEIIDTFAKIDTSKIGDKYISFFPLTEETTQVTRGLRWDLTNLVLKNEKVSISNEFIDKEVHIEMITGKLLAVWNHNNIPQRISKELEM